MRFDSCCTRATLTSALRERALNVFDDFVERFFVDAIRSRYLL